MSQAGPRSALTDTEALQRSAGNAAVTAAAALDGAARADIERRLGQPLPDARVHSGPEADAFLANERALGLARGRDVYLPAGVDPSGALGRTLIAHELAHVVQQTRAAPVDRAAELESEAEAVGFGEADAVAGSAPFGSSQRFLGLFEDEEEPPKKAELPPDFNRLQYARIAENPQAWKEALQYPAQAAHMRDDPAIRGLLQEDKEFQAWLANPKQLPPDYKPSAPLADADTAAERVRVPKVEQSFDDRTNTWTFTEDGQVVGQIKVPNKNSQFKVNWDRDQIVLDPSADKGVNLVGADPPQKTEAGAYVETAPLTVVGNQPQRKARPKEPTPQEKFVSQLSEEERKRAEANRGRPLKHYYTKEMAERDKVPGFLEMLDYAGPIPVGTIGWQLGTLVTGETISGLPVERSETAKQIGEEIAMGLAIDWATGKLLHGIGDLAGLGDDVLARGGSDLGDTLAREGTLSTDPMPHEVPNLTPDVPPQFEAPEVKVDTPEVKVEVPEGKVETPEAKVETPEQGKVETAETVDAPEKAPEPSPDAAGAGSTNDPRWRGRRRGMENVAAVQAGHRKSGHRIRTTGEVDSLALEDADINQLSSNTIESKGQGADRLWIERDSINIDGAITDRETALRYAKDPMFPNLTEDMVRNAPSVPGWQPATPMTGDQARAAFMDEMLDVISNNPNHPLRPLIEF